MDAGLRKGQNLTDTDITGLKKSDLIHRCSDAALHFLSYRPRSEIEVRNRLNKRGFDGNVIDLTINLLKKNALINDREFARYWCDNRVAYNPKARFILKKELRLKGINEDVARDAVKDVDETAAAYQAGKKKAKAFSGLDYEEFHKKLYNYLKWRGFNYEIINSVCERLWEQRNKIK